MSLISLRATDLVVEQQDWPWAEKERARIAAHWQAKQSANDELFDGRVLMNSRYEIEADVLRGVCFETDFSKFLAWRDFGFPDPNITNIFAMAALRTEDGAYLLGVMGAHTSNAGRIYFPAGTPDPHDIVDGRVDLAASVLRELYEETGLQPDAVEAQPGFTAIGRGQRLALMRDVLVRGPADAVRAQIRANLANQDERELDDVVIVRHTDDIRPSLMPDFIVDFLRARLA